MLSSLMISSLQEGDTARDFVFKEEYVDVLTCVIGIDQVFIPDLVQDTINQDTVE